MCSCIGRIPSSEQASSQVLRDKALLCSPSGDGMISWLRASVLMFFFLCSCGLACLRNSVDHFGNLLFSAAFCLHLTFGISALRWAHPVLMCLLGSTTLIALTHKPLQLCVNLLVGLVVMSQLSSGVVESAIQPDSQTQDL